METSKLELTKLAQLITSLETDTSDTETMLYNLNQLSTEELESVQSYFSGSGIRTFSKTFLQISMASFISGMTVFFFIKFQAELLVFFPWNRLFISMYLNFLPLYFKSANKVLSRNRNEQR
ncbi:hypothetical protein [Listeria cornellensis]|uniref:Uncharacterized protein n=1 Tax=Listeria cornellensis FSL F6-0969 TaxID=1265820 RepID=W7BG04_9LIST|nr:hypothetical protein [Listeria cornellensis]EUJ26059.1 hypothetical protein PCORN_15471 [Listeria cornellensis FSL F6-0969]